MGPLGVEGPFRAADLRRLAIEHEAGNEVESRDGRGEVEHILPLIGSAQRGRQHRRDRPPTLTTQ